MTERRRDGIGKAMHGRLRPSPHLQFAQGITGRYVRHPAPDRPALGMILAQSWRFQSILQRHLHRSTFIVTPHIGFRLAVMRRDMADRAYWEVPPAISTIRHVTSVIENATLLRRLMTHGQRVEETVRMRGTAPQVQRPVQQGIRPSASAPELIQQSPWQPVPEEMASAMAGRAGARLGTASAPLPSLDVNRLTDQVIQAIDRRIIAQRERLGRL